MRVATIFAGLPNPWRAGGPLTHWATLNALVAEGHEVVFCTLPWEEEPNRPAKLAALAELGVRVREIERPPAEPTANGRWGARAAYVRSLAWPDDAVLFPDSALAVTLDAAIEQEDPDVVLAHATHAISAAAGIRRRKLALTSDPPGLSRRIRTEIAPTYPWRLGRDELLYRLGSATFARRADERFLELLRAYDSVGIFAAHHAEWARCHGVPAWYASSPIVDAAGPDWRRRRAAAEHSDVPRILMIGHLRGISTISGLQVFARDVLPTLAAEFGDDGFEVEIVGDYEPPSALRASLDHPAVRLRGHVEPPDDEFLRADVVLVPTPIRTGPRVRILTAFAFGCCVVAHSANRLGIPALAHGQNVLLGETERLADLTIEALRDRDLRERLGAAGRRLYESRFTAEKAGRRIVEELEAIARRPRTPRVDWCLAGDRSLASSRLQGYVVHDELRRRGYESRLLFAPPFSMKDVPWPDRLHPTIARLCAGNVVVLQKLAGPRAERLVEALRAAGAATLYVHSDYEPENELPLRCDAIVCTSEWLADHYRRARAPRVAFIPDPVEWRVDRAEIDAHARKNSGLVLCWVGHRGNWETLGPLRELLRDPELAGVELVTVSNHADADIPWSLEAAVAAVADADVGVVTTRPAPYGCAKSSNRVVQLWAAGKPVVAGSAPAYEALVRDGWNGFLCDTPDEWRAALLALRDAPTRLELARNGYDTAVPAFLLGEIVKRWLEIFTSLAPSGVPRDTDAQRLATRIAAEAELAFAREALHRNLGLPVVARHALRAGTSPPLVPAVLGEVAAPAVPRALAAMRRRL